MRTPTNSALKPKVSASLSLTRDVASRINLSTPHLNRVSDYVQERLRQDLGNNVNAKSLA